MKKAMLFALVLFVLVCGPVSAQMFLTVDNPTSADVEVTMSFQEGGAHWFHQHNPQKPKKCRGAFIFAPDTSGPKKLEGCWKKGRGGALRSRATFFVPAGKKQAIFFLPEWVNRYVGSSYRTYSLKAGLHAKPLDRAKFEGEWRPRRPIRWRGVLSDLDLSAGGAGNDDHGVFTIEGIEPKKPAKPPAPVAGPGPEAGQTILRNGEVFTIVVEVMGKVLWHGDETSHARFSLPRGGTQTITPLEHGVTVVARPLSDECFTGNEWTYRVHMPRKGKSDTMIIRAVPVRPECRVSPDLHKVERGSVTLVAPDDCGISLELSGGVVGERRISLEPGDRTQVKFREAVIVDVEGIGSCKGTARWSFSAADNSGDTRTLDPR